MDDRGSTLYNMVKVWRHGPCILGMAGEVRILQAIQNKLVIQHVPQPGTPVQSWIINELMPAVEAVINEYEEPGVWDMLVGIGTELWCISSRWSVLRSWNGFDAIGSGREVALGSLYTSYQVNVAKEQRQEEGGPVIMELLPEACVVFALAAAVQYCSGVAPPFNYVSNIVMPERNTEDATIIPFKRPPTTPVASIVKDDDDDYDGNDDATG
jgi:hypothetical protein